MLTRQRHSTAQASSFVLVVCARSLRPHARFVGYASTIHLQIDRRADSQSYHTNNDYVIIGIDLEAVQIAAAKRGCVSNLLGQSGRLLLKSR